MMDCIYIYISEWGKKLSEMAVCMLIIERLEHTDIKQFPNKPYGPPQPASVKFYLNVLPKTPQISTHLVTSL